MPGGPVSPPLPAARTIGNPLTLIGVFAGLAEIAATAVLPFLEGTAQAQFIWFVMLFPVLLVLLFFATLNFNHHVMYAPKDFDDPEAFERVLGGQLAKEIEGRFAQTDAAENLRAFWKPGGTVNEGNQARLRTWLQENGLNSRSIAYFLSAEMFAQARDKAIVDLGLS